MKPTRREVLGALLAAPAVCAVAPAVEVAAVAAPEPKPGLHDLYAAGIQVFDKLFRKHGDQAERFQWVMTKELASLFPIGDGQVTQFVGLGVMQHQATMPCNFDFRVIGHGYKRCDLGRGSVFTVFIAAEGRLLDPSTWEFAEVRLSESWVGEWGVY